MKALSIRQPWAYAIVHGTKPVENRDWPTRVRGSVFIHAGKQQEVDEIEGVLRRIAAETDRDWKHIYSHYREHAQRGGIVGVANLVDCVTEHKSPWFYGPYGFVFANARPIHLIPVRGQLGFFEVPNDLEAA